VKDYLKRLVELAGAGFIAGAGQYVATSGFHLDGASLRGLGVAAGMAAYGVVVKKLGSDQDRPTVK
jgi:drug/metabolite transporter (DMT)-like permease